MYKTQERSANRKKAAFVGILQVLTVILMAALATSPASAAPTPNGPVPQAQLTVLNENFDAGFPGGNWSTSDDDSAGDYDYWGSSAYRTHSGAGSAWSAQVGDAREVGKVLFFDGFEGNVAANWTVSDQSATDGLDTWGQSNYRARSGTYSMWSAEVGDNSNYGGQNNAIHYYDDYQDSRMTRAITTTGCSNLVFSYYFWQYTEVNYDYFSIMYVDGSGTSTFVNRRDATSSGQFIAGSITIPAGTSAVGFRFETDSSVVYQGGVFVDDVQLVGDCATNNFDKHVYDIGMNATMSRAVDVTGFETAHAEFFYWSDTATSDFVEFVYYSNSQWISGWSFEGNSGGWALASVDIPLDTILVGFRFVTDGSVNAEGVYIDDVSIIVTVAPPTCDASVTPSLGIEATTEFAFLGLGTGGRAPLRFTWDFTDGSTRLLQTPLVTFTEAGTYSATLTVRDALAQECTAGPVSVTVDHDFSHIYIGPEYAVLNEGDVVEFGATDARGHGSFDFEWSLDSDLCGTVTGPGPRTTFSVSQEAGERSCSVIAAYGPASGSMTIPIQHNTSAISIFPAGATVFESKSVQLFGRDAFAHPLDLEWSTTCGRVTPATGPNTIFSASTTGGQVCTVTGYLGTKYTTAIINIEHDASTMVVSPATGTVIEGGFITLSARDGYQHPLRASWSVQPAACGSMSVELGDSSLLQAGVNAGGQVCTVTSTAFGYSKASTITVEHDFSSASISADSTVVSAGGATHITAYDAHGHQAAVDWAVAPSSCGQLSTNHSATVTLNVALTSAGISCTIRATVETKVLLLTIQVINAPPASLDIGLNQEFGFEGETVTATAVVKDAVNNTVDASLVVWTTDCQGVSPPSGRATSVQMKSGAAGTTCTVTATLGALSKTKTISVVSAARGNVALSPDIASIGAGAQQTFTVTVIDSSGKAVAPTSVAWHASCGQIVGTGASATYTAPGAASICTISATVNYEGQESSDSLSMTVTGSTIIVPIAAGAVIGIGALAGIALMLRRKKGPKAPSESPAWTGVAPPPTAEEAVGEAGEATEEEQQ